MGTMLARFALGLLFAAASVPIEAAPPARVELAYPSRLQARIVSRGQTYVATLVAIPDAWRDMSLLEISMTRLGRRGGRSLLYSEAGHGPQPYYFYASDHEAGSPGTIFANPRLIQIRGTRDELEVRVLDARVHPTGTMMHDAFDRLRVALAIRRDNGR